MAPKQVFPSRATVAAEMSRVPQSGRINIGAILLTAPVKYRQNVVEVPLTAIVKASPFQTRRALDPDTNESDRALVDSLADPKIGQMEAVWLREIKPGQYEIVFGHRRIAALRYLNRLTVLAVIVKGDLRDTATWTALENTGEPLSPIEKAELAQLLSTRLDMNTAEISIRLGVSQRHVQRLLKIANTAEDVRLAFSREVISGLIAYEIALAPKEHQARLVAITIACRLQPTDCARIVKRLAEDDSPDAAAKACGFTPPSETDQSEQADQMAMPSDSEIPNVIEAKTAHEINGDGQESVPDATVLDRDREEHSLEDENLPTDESLTRTPKMNFDPAATCKMLQGEMTSVDRGAVRTIVTKGIDRRLNQRDLRVAVLLAASTTPAKALDTAEALGNDLTAKLLAEIAENVGRVRDRVHRRQHNGMTTAMVQALIKELQILAGETKASKQ